MQCIPQLIELFKHFQLSAFIIFTQSEPLFLADSISDSLSNKSTILTSLTWSSIIRILYGVLMTISTLSFNG